MAEQYTNVFNLFDFPESIRDPWTTGVNPDNPTKMLFIVYVDGRIQIDGQAYLDSTLPNATILDNQILFDVSKVPELFKLIPTTTQFGVANSFINMYAKLVGSPSMEINFAEYRPASGHITYQVTADHQVVTNDRVWRFTGWLVPRSLKPASSLLWGTQ